MLEKNFKALHDSICVFQDRGVESRTFPEQELVAFPARPLVNCTILRHVVFLDLNCCPTFFTDHSPHGLAFKSTVFLDVFFCGDLVPSVPVGCSLLKTAPAGMVHFTRSQECPSDVAVLQQAEKAHSVIHPDVEFTLISHNENGVGLLKQKTLGRTLSCLNPQFTTASDMRLRLSMLD